MQQLATYYQMHHISPWFLLSVTICAAAPANENSIDDSPVETPPVLLLIEQIHDAAELVPFAMHE